MSPQFMLSVVSVDVSEGCIKGELAKAAATKYTKDRSAQYVEHNSMERAPFAGMRLKTEEPAPEVAIGDDTPTWGGSSSPDYEHQFSNFSPVFDSPSHAWQRVFNSESCAPAVEDSFSHCSPGITPGDAFMLTPHNRSDSSDFANFVFHTKSEAGSLPVENCQQFRDPAENFSQVSLACSSIEQCSGDSAQVANSTQDSVPSCGACDENAGFFDFESFMNMRGPALDVKIVAVTAKTSLSQKIDLEKLCSADSTHFGFRVAKLDNSQEAPRQTQDFRNSIQYLLAFPTSCDEKKFTGRIFNNGTVTISSIQPSHDITGTVDSCLQAVVNQIQSAHYASVAAGSVVVLNFEAQDIDALSFANPQLSLNLTFALGYRVSYPKLRGIFKQGDEFVGLDDTKIIINSMKEEQKCGQGVFLKVTQLKFSGGKFSEEFHASFTIFHTGTVQARGTCCNIEEMEFLLSNMYHILNLHQSEIEPAGPAEEFVSKRRGSKQTTAAARSHPYECSVAKAPAARKRKQPTRA
jgi:hypothetical protein